MLNTAQVVSGGANVGANIRAKPRHLSYIYIYIFIDNRIIPHVQMMFLGTSASNRLCTPFKAEEAQEAAGDEAGNKRLCSHKATENWQPPLSIYIYEGIFCWPLDFVSPFLV